jgi:hypothetical protein
MLLLGWRWRQEAADAIGGASCWLLSSGTPPWWHDRVLAGVYWRIEAKRAHERYEREAGLRRLTPPLGEQEMRPTRAAERTETSH